MLLSASSLLILSATAQAEQHKAYIGTYSPHGEGVYLTYIDSENGAMTAPKLVADVENGAQLIYNANAKTLYVASEISNYNGLEQGAIIAYRVNNNGSLTELNRVASVGKAPVYLALHPTNNYLFVANYVSGSIAVFSIDKNGKLSISPSDSKQSSGEPGLGYPEAAVIGSFAISDHDGPHAHMIAPDPSGNFVFSTDLGLDRIYQWRFDREEGLLTANSTAYLDASSRGAGPRHFVFHPNGKHVYLINEESSTLTRYDFDSDNGMLTERSSISSLPENYQGSSYASGIIIDKAGKNLYIANRLHNSISQFAIDNNGELRLVDNVWTRGDYTRTIVFSPDQNYVYAMNQRSDNVAYFAVDSKTGKLTFVDDYVAVGSPSQMVFADK